MSTGLYDDIVAEKATPHTGLFDDIIKEPEHRTPAVASGYPSTTRVQAEATPEETAQVDTELSALKAADAALPKRRVLPTAGEVVQSFVEAPSNLLKGTTAILNAPFQALGYKPPYETGKPIPAIAPLFEAAKKAPLAMPTVASAIQTLAPDSTAGQIAKGAREAVIDFAAGLTSPEMLATLPVAAEARAAQAVKTGFGMMMAASLPESVQQAVQVASSPTATPQEKAKAITSAGIQALVTGGIVAPEFIKRGVEIKLQKEPGTVLVENAKPILPIAATEAEKVIAENAQRPTTPEGRPTGEPKPATVPVAPPEATAEVVKAPEAATAPAEVPVEQARVTIQPLNEFLADRGITEESPTTTRLAAFREYSAMLDDIHRKLVEGAKPKELTAEPITSAVEPVKESPGQPETPAPIEPTGARPAEKLGNQPEGGGPPVVEPTIAQVTPPKEPVKSALQPQTTASTPTPSETKSVERLTIRPRSDGLVTLEDTSGARLGTFKTVDDAGKTAIELGYDVSPGSELKPSWMQKPPEVIAAENAAQEAFEKLGSAERGISDKSKRKGMTKAQLARLGTYDQAVENERKAKQEWRSRKPKPTMAPSTQVGGMAGTISGQKLTPAATPISYPALSPKSQRQIITDIAKGLDIPIRFGRLRTTKFGGYFLKTPNLIGSKLANDIPVVAHEVGHKVDATFNLSSDPAIVGELNALGDPSLPGSRSSWTPSKSSAYRKGEGLAEFTRHWLTDPSEAQRLAPNTYRRFESILDANKDMGDVLRQAREDINLWRTAEPQARLRSHISVGTNPNETRYTLSDAARDLIDDLHYIRLAVDDYRKFSGTTLLPSKNIYLLARNLRGSFGMADTFVRDGVSDFKTKAVTLGTSLQDALTPVGGRLNDFRDWIVAKQAQELRRQGKESGLVASDVDTVAARFENDPVFQEAFVKVKAWNDALLRYAVDSGLITMESADAMRKMNQDYVPFHRVFEVGAGEPSSVESTGIGRGLNLGKPGSMRARTGSTRDIVDPIETMIKNAYTVITASEKSAINTTLASYAGAPNMGRWVEKIATPKQMIEVGVDKIRKQLEAAGADLETVPDDLLLQFFQNSGRAPFGENVIRVVVNGKPEFYRLRRELYDTFHALDLEDSGKLVRIFSAPANLLRAGVTMAPDFALANALRDTFSAAIISRYGSFPFEVTLKGIAAMIKDPKLVSEWAASGGKNAVEATYFDRAQLQRFLREHISKELTPAEQALIYAKSPLVALRHLTGISEEATRIGEYKTTYDKLIKSGMSEGEARRLAAFESRDRQDFAKGGAKTKIIRHAAAFWNAGLQANVRLYQAFRENPVGTILKGLAFITIPKLLEQAVNYDDKDYWDRPQWERDLFFLIPFGKDEIGHTKFIRIPTPFEPGIIFGSFPGRVVQYAKQNRKEAFAEFPNTVLQNSVPNPIPQTLQVIFADFLSGAKGWDIFRGRTVVPESIATLPTDMQWTEQTSLTARKLGNLFGMSPMKIDHIIQGTTGGLGRQVTHQILDRAIAATAGGKRAEIQTVPGGRFVTTPSPVASQSVEDFYTVLNDLRAENQRLKHGSVSVKDLSILKEFETTAKAMSDARAKSRVATSAFEKRVEQEQVLKLARDMMDKYYILRSQPQP